MVISIMEKNEAGEIVLGCMCGRRVAILNRVAREGIIGKVTFDQRPGRGTRITYADIWGNSKCQAQGAEACLKDQQRGHSDPSEMIGGKSVRN